MEKILKSFTGASTKVVLYLVTEVNFDDIYYRINFTRYSGARVDHIDTYNYYNKKEAFGAFKQFVEPLLF